MMALAETDVAPRVLTYEAYMEEDEIFARYDILDGVRHFMTQPTIEHQDIALNTAMLLRAFQQRTPIGKTIIAPCDVLVTLSPFRTRQPDVLFITHERFGGRALRDASPLSPAPELVVEVLSRSDTRAVKAGKIADFCTVDVRECWLVSPQEASVEVLRLTSAGPQSVQVYTQGDTLHSITFAELAVSVDDVFAV